jgi:hypothetical protein
MANQRCLEITVQITKAVVYLLVFVIVLGSGVIAKGTILFMTSQLKAGRTLVYCNRQLGKRDILSLFPNSFSLSLSRLSSFSLTFVLLAPFFPTRVCFSFQPVESISDGRCN